MIKLSTVPGSASHPSPVQSNSVSWGWWDILRVVAMLIGGVLLFCLLLFVALITFSILGRDVDAPIMTNVVSIGFYVILFVGIYWCTVRRYGSAWAALGVRRVSWWWLLISPACFGCMLLIAMVIQRALAILMGQPFFNPQVQMLTQGKPLRPIDLVLQLLCVAIVGPIVEELFFRGMLYPVMRRHAPAWIAIVLNAALFAMLHFIPIMLPMLFVSGVVFALVRERTDSLIPGMLIHSLQNAVFVIWLYIAFHS